MKITNLKDSPELIEETQILIERSFNYPSNQSFSVDFYPLYNKDNFQNCFVLIEDDQVLAHIGARSCRLLKSSIVMLGGIAVDERVRGRGLFKKLIDYVLTQFSECAMFFLWSDKLDMYQKFGFYPAVTLFEYSQKDHTPKYKVDCINWNEFDFEDFYTNTGENRIERTSEDWEKIKSIVSAEVYVMKDKGRVINYFVKGKGADLSGIIHEYGSIDNNQLDTMRAFGKVWSPQKFDDNISLYGTVAKIGDQTAFKTFVLNYTGLEIQTIDSLSVEFIFEGQNITLSHLEFLQGILGPNVFKELDCLKPLFISGLDSI